MKQINFFNRKRNESYVADEAEKITDRRLTITSVLDKETKRMEKQSEFITIDVKSDLSKYKVSDFALENLLAVGATLKPCVLQGSRFENIRRIESSLENIQTMSNENKTE